MEQIHGVDVSWMTHGNPKDSAAKIATRQRSLSQQRMQQQQQPALPQIPAPGSPTTTPAPNPAGVNGNSNGPAATPVNAPAQPKPITGSRPGFSRTGSAEKLASTSPGSSPQRRGSWFSNISSKFSSSGGGGAGVNSGSPPLATPGNNTSNTAPKPADPPIPKANPVKNAVLQHAVKYEGDGPYTPAPPKSGQTGLLHVFRRLSVSNGALVPSIKGHNHGLVERRTLNIDQHRERCPIAELNQSNLRRVAFCVDVEIAPMPKYGEPDAAANKKLPTSTTDKVQKLKMTEKGEGVALKQAKAKQDENTPNGKLDAVQEDEPPSVPEKDVPVGDDKKSAAVETIEADAGDADDAASEKAASDNRKKEKKKKSEEERKARKEKKRKLAEANGTIPMEIHFGSDSSGTSTPTGESTPRTQSVPTTNPVRVYRRCCQLRETPILKRITEQLTNQANSSEDGVVEKLDLTGYWMQLPDLITLGDYLAIVPVREVVLENCGLTDEGVRVILAGLLTAKKTVLTKHKHAEGEPDGLTEQGGFVERLILKNNKVGPEGWKHICLFLYLCRSLKALDISSLTFPQPRADGQQSGAHAGNNGPRLCELLSRSIGDRLGGSTLGLLNLGETGLTTPQLGAVIDGVIKCGVPRLGIAHNDIGEKGMEHVARYIKSGKAEAVDLGGNDLRDFLGVLAEAITPGHQLWGLSLAECNLLPKSLCKLLPTLTKLDNFRFIDLSHNRDLFTHDPSAIPVLRRYLPKMSLLKRIHLADCGLSPDQAIALAEIIPEVPQLAHISFLENPELSALADAKTEEAQEEACAFYASLLAASRVSQTIVCIDIDVPSEQSADLVKAMAQHVVAYCLRNLERLPLSNIAAAAVGMQTAASRPDPDYPDVLQHLVGHDVLEPDTESDADPAPDADYVIGGTGVAKALLSCLENRGDESRRQSGEFIREAEGEMPMSRPTVSSGRAKDMSKHLLASARKIRQRLQPALEKAKSSSNKDFHAFHRLLFLDNTLKGIIKRFEDEFPETRESMDSAISMSAPVTEQLSERRPSEEEVYPPAGASDGEDEVEGEGDGEGSDRGVKSGLSRSNSVLSVTSKALANEEGRVLRAGHKFRAGIIKPEHYGLLSGIEEIGADPNHSRVLHEMLEELGDEEIMKKVAEKGVVLTYKEDQDRVLQLLKDADPDHWERFLESQKMAKANVQVSSEKAPLLMTTTREAIEQAIADDRRSNALES